MPGSPIIVTTRFGNSADLITRRPIAERFHEAVEKEVMPVVRALQAERKRQMGLPSLRPWDLAVDPLNRPPLRPFQDVEQMLVHTQKVFDHLDRDLAQGFERMRNLKLLDLANRKGKAPGGYQSTLSEARLPFIFMNAVGVQRDVETILHEAGHAFHALATRDEDLYRYRGAPIEFCEVASMSMEFLGNEFLGEFYAKPEADRARKTHMEQVIGLTFPWIATVDAFQHWIYTHPGHSRAERKRRGWSAWTGSPGMSIGPGWKRRRATTGIGNCIFFFIHFTTSNTASRSLARFRCGRIRSETKRKRSTHTNPPWDSAVPRRYPSYFLPRAASSTSVAKPWLRW